MKSSTSTAFITTFVAAAGLSLPYVGCRSDTEPAGEYSSQQTTAPGADAYRRSQADTDNSDTENSDAASVTEDEVMQETSEAVAVAEKFAQEQREQYRQEVEARLAKIEEHIEALQTQLAEAPSSDAQNVKQIFDTMQNRINEAREKVTNQKANTEEAWTSLRNEVDAAIDEVKRSAQEVQAEMETDGGEETEGASN